MSSARFRKIREKLELTQGELAEVLGLSGKEVVSRIEAGTRNPSKLAMAVMEILGESSPRKANELIELLKAHVAKITKDSNE
ncbi:helix-turn-helix transcriptional regulator [Bdellovibrio sp.]|uniref:helix-turn-helix transcriptional regulator n=1 Tax=Bdellovibrio sp. TaxID=28201 RepID=UPI0039E6C9C1